MPIIQEHFPELYPKYRRAYRGTGAAPKRYTDAIVKRFREVAAEVGIAVRDPLMDEVARGRGAQGHRGRDVGETVEILSLSDQMAFWE